MTSTIHDLGYQRYQGERLGTEAAWRALFLQGLRTMFGLGRSARAKALPVILLVLSTLPAVFAVAIAAVVSDRAPVPVGHGNYFAGVALLYVLFAAAQAPELFSRDQANRVLPLLLSRDLTRWQYASARLAAVVAALWLIGLLPHLLLLAGGIGTAADTVAMLRERSSLLGPILVSTGAGALVLGGISSAIAAFTARRFLASAAIAGLFIVLAGVRATLDRGERVAPAFAELLDPLLLVANANRLLFAEVGPPASGTTALDLPGYLAALLVVAGAAMAAVWWRAQRVPA